MLVSDVWLLAIRRPERKALWNGIRFLVAERVSGFLADITRSPTYNQAAFLNVLPHAHVQGVKYSVLSVIVCRRQHKNSPDLEI